MALRMFFYVPLGKFTRPELLSFLRTSYGIPSSRTKGGFGQLADAMRLVVLSRGPIDCVESLVFQRMAGFSGKGAGRPIASTNFYDKYLKAEKDAGALNIAIGRDEDVAFLKSHVRVDVTLLEGAISTALDGRWAWAGRAQRV